MIDRSLCQARGFQPKRAILSRLLKTGSPKIVVAGLVALFFASSLPRSFAHTSYSTQIREVTEELGSKPNDPDLLVRRGILHFLNGAWQKAMNDFGAAERAGANVENVLSFLRAKTILGQVNDAKFSGNTVARLGTALNDIDMHLKSHPNRPEAVRVRAEILAKLGRRKEAIVTHARLLNANLKLSPAFFTRHADMLASDGRVTEAVGVLDEGISRKGDLVVLQKKVIDLQIKNRNFDEAIERLDTLIETSPRKDVYLARKADVQLMAGQAAEAKASYEAAQEEIEALPLHLQNKVSVNELLEHIDTQIEQIDR